MEIVHKIEDGMDRQKILCTTYQMRNFYQQLGGAYFSVLDIMNYIQHHQIVKWCKPDMHILDVCCGRGLLLPMLRYQVKNLGSYTGVDIRPKNAIFTHKRVTDNKPIGDDYYPFPVRYIEANVAEMSSLIDRTFDLIVYTSSIEHMHPDSGLQSLKECAKLSKQNTILALTCPNTPEDQDGYDTKYKAHVYEWKHSELIKGLSVSGFEIIKEFGLLANKKDLVKQLKLINFPIDELSKFIPNEWLIPILSPLFPEISKEIGFLCKMK